MLQAFANGTVFGERYGSGPVEVLWLHGWGRRGADFARSAHELLDQGVSSVAVDLPGFGASPLPHEVGGARLYAELVASLISDDFSAPVVLVGHSFGGRVALVVAARHPELVHGVVLTGVPLLHKGGTSRSPRQYRMIRSLARAHLISPERLERARQKYGSEDYRRASGPLRDILVASVNESYEEELGLWSGPTKLIWGAEDRDVPVAVAERAQLLLGPASSLEVLAGVGHLTPTEAPSALTAAAAGLVRR